MDIQVSVTGEDRASCAYCRGDVGDDRVTCAGCGVVAHDDCARELVDCPTPGCGRRLAEGPARPRAATKDPKLEPPRPRSRARWVVRLVVLALLLLLGARHRDTLRAAGMSTAAREREAEALMREGATLMQRGRGGERAAFDAAIDLFERAATLHPGPRGRYALEQVGHAQAELGDVDAALATFTEIIDRESGHVLGYYARGSLRLRTGDLAGALADFDASITIVDPHLRQGAIDDRWEHRAECRARLGDHAGAVADYRTFLSLGAWVRAQYERRIAERPDSPEAAAMREALR